MSTFKKVSTKSLVKSNHEASLDNSYWKNYGIPVLVKEFGPIDYIDFSPLETHRFAVTCSCRVQIYNSITKLATKNLNRFKEVAYGGTFRRDGRLLCTGGSEALIKLFDVDTKNLLRIFSGHTAPVHRTFFTVDEQHIVSFSDDKSSAFWDIPSEKKIISFEDHVDYVRAGHVSPVSPNIYLSGSYDSIVNMYDTRSSKKVLSVNHNGPIESVLFLPSGGIFLSAGGTEIKVWDCITNGRLLAKISQHHKTITCLQVASNGQVIISGSLDRHVKIHDTGSYKTLHTLNYPNSVLSIGISRDDKTIVAGMTDGMMSIRQKEPNAQEKTSINQKMSYKYAGETIHYLHINSCIPEIKRQMEGKHNTCLRKFQYSKAVDCVMLNYITSKSPHLTVSVFQELIRRKGLIQALAGRNGKSLFNVLRFIIRHIGCPRFERVLLHVTSTLIDIYEDQLEDLCSESQHNFKVLQKKLEEEQKLMLSLIQLRGSLEILMSAAETTLFTLQNSCGLKPSTMAQRDFVFSYVK
ncbi:U3 small nucleolar RNA-associated protein 15 homolog [Copidosoma floridanum]|uniref:U3 small nucleolar RNA-associated protein 15 homolog n=1 Tax=Copidosoma floridanum TaxID=29053 RepID=UPI0006C97CF8|nr:U3 small nucleolar RNA-associated protein 15 homolog [Copidosoma floridanum]